MRRTLDDTLLALREQLRVWAEGRARADVRVLVYTPELEAALLARLPDFTKEYAATTFPIQVIDIGQEFLIALESRPRRLATLLADDAADKSSAARDAGAIASALLERVIQLDPAPPARARILANTGALATIVSYSAIVNRLYDAVTTPVILLFPGEGNDRALNLLGLRADPTYRAPRI